jgi:hypothetical protein
MNRRAAWPLVIALILVAVLRIVGTYGVLNNTVDEPLHIAAGMEWLDHGTYEYEAMHPPLRAVFAIGPRLLGGHYHGAPDLMKEGNRILYDDGEYWRMLTSARVAALPFLALTAVLVFVWARRVAGPLAGLFAVLAYTTLPLALAHAGFATTDTLLAATLTCVLLAWGRWLARPAYARAALLGAAIAVSMYAKLSTLLFVGVIVAVTGALWLLHAPGTARAQAPDRFAARLGRAAGAAALAALALVLVLWAAYRFTLEPALAAAGRPHLRVDALVGAAGLLHDIAYAVVELPIPARNMLLGLVELTQLNDVIPASYFHGRPIEAGAVAFFPVGILIKTPIAFLLLMAAGTVLLLRRALRSDEPLALLPAVAPLLIVAACLPSHINLGMRHVLGAFPLLAVCAGTAAAWLWQSWPAAAAWQRVAGRGAVVLLFGWQLLAGIRAHPDYLAYFNECCAANPQRWLVNSDLDWGQDLQRLALELRRRGVEHVHIAYFGTADIERHGLPPHDALVPYRPVQGWVAISEFRVALGAWEPPYDQYGWLRDYQPVARVGSSIRLYNIP